MSLDAIIIADSGQDSLSETNPLKLKIDGKTATIQRIANYIENKGRITAPMAGDGMMSWSSAYKLNGVFLLDYLKKSRFDVALINDYYKERDAFRNLLGHDPKTVVISTTFIYNKEALRRLVTDIRSLAPDICIIVGGPYIYTSYLILQRSAEKDYDTDSANKDYMFLQVDDEPSVDVYIVSPCGERTLCEVLRRVQENSPLDTLPNTASLAGKSYRFTKQILDTPAADNYTITWETLPDMIFESGVVPMQASRGCPFRCAFCNFTKDRRFNYVKPLDALIKELKQISLRGTRYVWFVDDIFRLGKRDLNSFSQRMIDEDIHLYWMSFIRASTLKNVNLDLLRQSGCIELQIGLESGDPQILHNMNKKVNPILYAEVIRKLLRAGINCSCYFIFGFPGESDETASRTRQFIKSIEHPDLEGILSWSIFPFLLSPLSPIYEPEIRKTYGLTGYMEDWRHDTMNILEAKEQIKKTFFELENSGPIYREDNLELLRDLAPPDRKEFVSARQRLSKLAMKCPLEKRNVIKSFNEILNSGVRA